VNTPDSPSPRSNRSPIRYAVVGGGHISQAAFMPAFEQADGSELVALVTGDEVKRTELPRRYDNLTAVRYEQYDELLASGTVDAVYIALPNWMHCEYAVRAARHGVHVLCEKPLAVDERECEQMMRAAEENGVELMVAYRLHFDPANLEAIRRVTNGELGDPRIFVSSFTLDVEAGNIRLSAPRRGGGPVYDLGVYCINAARYLFRQEPKLVAAAAASRDDPRFSASPETVSATLTFEGGRIATFVVGFGSSSTSRFSVIGTRGSLAMEPAYDYARAPRFTLEVDGERSEHDFPAHDQFAAQLVYFSECIATGRTPEPDGREGIADVRIVQAIHESIAQGGGPIRLLPVDPGARPHPNQAIVRPQPQERPAELRVSSPRRSESEPSASEHEAAKR
jgi:predicted dehydrogenase